ncbi:hypothetical protein GCM10022382_24900 [Microbacterium invictum]
MTLSREDRLEACGTIASPPDGLPVSTVANRDPWDYVEVRRALDGLIQDVVRLRTRSEGESRLSRRDVCVRAGRYGVVGKHPPQRTGLDRLQRPRHARQPNDCSTGEVLSAALSSIALRRAEQTRSIGASSPQPSRSNA